MEKFDTNKAVQGSGKSRALNAFFKHYTFFPPLIMLLLLFLGYRYILEPKYNQVILAIENEITAKEGEYSRFETKFNELSGAKRAYDRLSQVDIAKINEMLPGPYTSSEKYLLMEMIESIVTDKRMKMNSVSWPREVAVNKPGNQSAAGKKNSKQTAEPVGALDMDLNVSGVDYRGLKILLDALEYNLRLIDVKNVQFSPGGQSVRLTLRTYYYNSAD